MKIIENENLSLWNFWKVGGASDYFCTPQTKEELQEALIWAENNNQPITVLGKGTNVLISDEGVEGLVICTSKLINIECKEQNGFFSISAEAGLLKSHLMTLFRKHKLSPALFLSGLPGDIGGGVVMNAGVGVDFHPKEFSQIVESFDTITAKGMKSYKKEDIEWNYRSTQNWEGVIYKIYFSWPLEVEKEINQKIKDALKRRRSTQPLDKLTCGSTFKNPYPFFAGELIEKLGLKGLRKGEAYISEKHGNFIINEGKASAKDINYLIKKVKNEVKNNFNIDLETEVRYLGRWSCDEFKK